MISDTHRFLLKQMLQYEIDNYIVPSQFKDKHEWPDHILTDAKAYLESRVKELSETK